jgi:transcriptional regulator with AAA-type ATPase domain
MVTRDDGRGVAARSGESFDAAEDIERMGPSARRGGDSLADGIDEALPPPSSDQDGPHSQVTLELAVLPKPKRWLVEVQDQAGCRTFPLDRERIVLGAGRGVDIVLEDPAVSGRHCALAALGDGVEVEDLGSRNGTYVGSARVPKAWADVGTVITVGRSSIVLYARDDLDGDIPKCDLLPGVAGGSVAMRRVAAQVRRLAQHNQPVLIAGETGTGKELVARALHTEGARKGGPFVAINVAALPRELVESEMFGHERGAFTGAVHKRAGAFADAEGGTLFLDEIGELPLDAQAKLLRPLDGYEVRRVGAAGGGRRANVRIVAATHASLEALVASGTFRRDLFHRLEVFVVRVPPLRERRGDIGAIAQAILREVAADFGRRELTSGALARLSAHKWEGNARELRNVLVRAADASQGRRLIEAADIEGAFPARETKKPAELTPELAKAILREHGNNMSAAARAVDYPRTSFRKLVNRAELDRIDDAVDDDDVPRKRRA